MTQGSPKPERCGNEACLDPEVTWGSFYERWSCLACGWHPADPARCLECAYAENRAGKVVACVDG